MTQTITATQKMFTLDGVTYSQMKSGYCFKTTGLKDKKGQDITRRIPEKVFDEAYEQYVNQQWDIEKEVEARREAEEQKDRETEATFNGTKKDRRVYTYHTSYQGMTCYVVEENGKEVYCGFSVTEIEHNFGFNPNDYAEGEEIVVSKTKETKPEVKKEAKKASKPRKSKDIAHESNGVTLTAKQVDFMNHLPDTCFWDNGLDSMPWCDVLADEIGGQFAGKPMTVGAMISTLREKGVLEVGRQKVNGRMAKYMALTEVGKQVARELGLK